MTFGGIVVVGIAIAPAWRTVGIARFDAILNWLQEGSALTLVGGLRSVSTRPTFVVALIGAALAAVRPCPAVFVGTHRRAWTSVSGTLGSRQRTFFGSAVAAGSFRIGVRAILRALLVLAGHASVESDGDEPDEDDAAAATGGVRSKSPQKTAWRVVRVGFWNARKKTGTIVSCASKPIFTAGQGRWH